MSNQPAVKAMPEIYLNYANKDGKYQATHDMANALLNIDGPFTQLGGVLLKGLGAYRNTQANQAAWALKNWQEQQAEASKMAETLRQWEREDDVANRNREWALEDAQTERNNKMAETLRQWKREDSRDKQKRDWELQDRDAGYNYDMAKFLATYQQKQAEKQEKKELESEAKAKSEDAAMRGLAELQGVADRGNIGPWTRWRQGMGLLGDESEQDLGKQSAALAAIAPAAISKLKEAGVSGVNSLPEFMTYVGLGEDPTSKQIAGALPIIANTLGFSDPAVSKSAYPAAVAPAPKHASQAYEKYGL